MHKNLPPPDPILLAQLLRGSRAYYSWVNEGMIYVGEKSRHQLTVCHRSGKSSISSVVFHKLPPNETLFLESTARIQKDSMALVLAIL